MADTTMTIAGNLADDPELRYTQAGTPVTTFVVMLNERREQNGEWVEVAKNGMRCTAWRDLAENAAESLAKGDRVLVTGRLVPQQWKDRDTGQDRYGWAMTAEDVAPSLKWATARPEKARRGQGGQSRGQQQGGFTSRPQGDYDAPPF